jgi:hypothetical protein
MDCYTSFEESLSDFYADLPWTQVGAVESLRLILADPRLPEIQRVILALHNFELGAELDAALRHHESG